MTKRQYPTIDGIAVPVFEINLPERHRREENNHHNEWDRRTMGRLAVTQLLRDLARHQYVLPVDVHEWLHVTYDPPKLPTEAEAAKEVICAYERGEQFKIYNRSTGEYDFHPIPLAIVDDLIKEHRLYGVLDDKIGRKLDEEIKNQSFDPSSKERLYRIQTSEEFPNDPERQATENSHSSVDPSSHGDHPGRRARGARRSSRR